MNNEENNLNQQSGIEVFSLDSTVPNGMSVNQENVINSSTNMNVSEATAVFNGTASSTQLINQTQTEVMPSTGSLTSNAFAYTDVQPENIVTPVAPAQNTFAYAESPVETNVATSEPVQNQFIYTDLKDVQQQVDEPKQYTPQNQQANTNNYVASNNPETKSNFGFMLVFALIMIAIIVALPYIAGYK